MTETNTLVKCPYCEEIYISEEYMTCKSCERKADLDISVYELISCLDKLNQFEPKELVRRLELLMKAKTDLENLLYNKVTKAL